MPSDTPQVSAASLPSATGIHVPSCEERTVVKGPSKSGTARAGEAPRKRRSEEKHPERTPLDDATPPSLLTGVAGILVQKHLAKRKREIITRYMEIVSQWLEPRAAALDHKHSGDAKSPRRGPAAASSLAARRLSMKKVIGQKRQLSDDEPDGNQDCSLDADGVGSGQQRQQQQQPPATRTVKRSRIDEGDSLRLACPYFQRDPSRFANALTCRGHSWPTISRLKEHLHRTHQRPQYQCKRCRSLFVEEGDLEDHQTQETACKLDKRAAPKHDTLDGFDADQSERLKKRLVGKSVDEKWREMYCILFCLDPKTATIPSPYYSPIPPETLKSGAPERLRQLVPVIQNTIALHLDRELSALLSSRQTICAITTRINDEVNSVIRTFGEITPAPAMASGEASSSPPEGSDPDHDIAAPDALSAPEEPSTSELYSIFDIDGLMAHINSSAPNWLFGDMAGGVNAFNDSDELGILGAGGHGAHAGGDWGSVLAEGVLSEVVPTDGSEVSDLFSGAGPTTSSFSIGSVGSARHDSPDDDKK